MLLVINTNMLRELDERKLIHAYARYVYESEKDLSDDNNIKLNLIRLFDWDINGDNGLGIYCGRFESIKRKDWIKLIQFIKENSYEIEKLSTLITFASVTSMVSYSKSVTFLRASFSLIASIITSLVSS